MSVTLICEFCGESRTRRFRRGRVERFCSHECLLNWRRGVKEATAEYVAQQKATCDVRLCDRCGEALLPTQSRWCSWPCRYPGSAGHSKTMSERFWSKVDKNGPVPPHAPELGPCWLWTATRSDTGYGWFSLGRGKGIGAHRYAYELLVGPIPLGLHLDHLCRIRPCIRPSHTEPVTPAENLRRGEAPAAVIRRSGYCSKGHEMTLENTYIRPDGHGVQCLTCNRANRATRTQRDQQRRALSQ